MAYSYEDILQSQAQALDAEQAQAAAELEAGRLSQDALRTNEAANRILEIDVKRNALGERARQFYAGAQAQPQANKYGLSDTEAQIARNSFSAVDMSDDDKLRLYAENRSKLQQMRATGQYRDDQGTVRR